MGEAAGKKGVWAYAEGGMGSISNAIADAATEAGAEICVNATVDRILYKNTSVSGVRMKDGTELYADTVLAGCTPYHVFMELLPGLSRDSGNTDEQSPVPPEFVRHIRFTDHACGCFKINCNKHIMNASSAQLTPGATQVLLTSSLTLPATLVTHQAHRGPSTLAQYILRTEWKSWSTLTGKLPWGSRPTDRQSK